MTPARTNAIGFLAIIAAILLAAISYYLAWRSGCVFDSKQGIGDAQLGLALSSWAIVLAVLAGAAIASSVVLLTRRTLPILMGSFLFFGVLGIPLTILGLAAADASGTASCSPQV